FLALGHPQLTSQAHGSQVQASPQQQRVSFGSTWAHRHSDEQFLQAHCGSSVMFFSIDFGTQGYRRSQPPNSYRPSALFA
ncbi:MAG: hypothetical protein AAGA89_16160, partial [Pseudomonadota bacterium]